MVSRLPFRDSNPDPDRDLFRHATSVKIELLASDDKTVISFAVKGIYSSSTADDDDNQSDVAIQEPLQDPVEFAQSLLSRFAKSQRTKGGDA